ncbi:MAG: hypothetical protein P4L31_07585 [Candidatus Babeliales bacterium]|nr:hypothetical protein [Candidatus Babeliales bacterium]
MSNRLDKDREAKLTPTRMQTAISELEKLGKYVERDDDKKAIYFIHNKEMITYYPYSGWATGKSITDGRGLNNLLKQLKNGTGNKIK